MNERAGGTVVEESNNPFDGLDFEQDNPESIAERQNTIVQLIEYYGAQQFKYGSHVGTISTIIDVCPAAETYVNQGFEAVTDWVDAYKVDSTQEVEDKSEETVTESSHEDTTIPKPEDSMVKAQPEKPPAPVVEKEMSSTDTVPQPVATQARETETEADTNTTSLSDSAKQPKTITTKDVVSSEALPVAVPIVTREVMSGSAVSKKDVVAPTELSEKVIEPSQDGDTMKAEQAELAIELDSEAGILETNEAAPEVLDEVGRLQAMELQEVPLASPLEDQVVELPSIIEIDTDEAVDAVESFVPVMDEITEESFMSPNEAEITENTMNEIVDVQTAEPTFDAQFIEVPVLKTDSMDEPKEPTLRLNEIIKLSQEQTLEGEQPEILESVASELALEIMTIQPEAYEAKLVRASEAVDSLQKATTAKECMEALNELRTALRELLEELGYENADELVERMIKYFDIAALQEIILRLQIIIRQNGAMAPSHILQKNHFSIGSHVVRRMIDSIHPLAA